MTDPIYEYTKGQGWVAQLGILVSFRKIPCRITVTDKPVIGKHYDYWVKTDDVWDSKNNKPLWDIITQRYEGYSLGGDISLMTARDYTYFESIGYYGNDRFWLVIEEVK